MTISEEQDVRGSAEPHEQVTVQPIVGRLGPLEGLRVIEAGSLIAAPFAGRIFADLGAEVIKIESPTVRDPLRNWGAALLGDRGLWWPIQSRNKKLVTLDLKKGQELFLRLVTHSDVVLENFRPGTMERWGLGYDVLSRANPDLLMCRVSGFGQDGPYAERAGFASVAEAVSGLRALNGYPDRPPPRSGLSLGDSIGALFAVIGTLAALYRRHTGGGGQVIDVALTEACLAMLESVVPEFDRLGVVRRPTGSSLPGIAPSNIYLARDGAWVVIAANQDSLFRRLCNALNRPELVDDPRFATHTARGANSEALDAIIAEWVEQRDAAELEAILGDAGVACGRVNTVADVVRDPQFRARNAFELHHDEEIGPILGPGIVPRFSKTPGSVRWSGKWTPGADNREIYAGLLGLDDGQLQELTREGVI